MKARNPKFFFVEKILQLFLHFRNFSLNVAFVSHIRMLYTSSKYHTYRKGGVDIDKFKII